ncbi:MAG: SH3 domain-containing protein [Chloroflexota bacterium]|nr:SH3 domain-containing protein [Chloroflexota bacterium]
MTTAQGSDLAALLEVLDGTVEVRRVNTEQWIAVKIEAIVGVGDHIRTDATGRARITFFADGIETELLADTETRIDSFNGSEQTFNLNLAVVVGQTVQRIGRALDASSSYNVTTPGMSLAARGTLFEVRVEDDGRSAMLVRESTVEASKDGENAAVTPGFGIRSEAETALSAVVAATTFEELYAALDGCPATLTTPDDVSLNVRLAPRLDAPRIGTIAAADVTELFGVTEAGEWYRLEFRGGFGWVLSSTSTIGTPCAGLRVFADNYLGEDTTLYSELGDVVQLEDLVTPEPTPGS